MSKKIKISDLTFDDKNFNRGTEYGKELIQKSLGKFGAGRSILIDKKGRIIAGNKTAENFSELGLENVKVIETDGKTLIAVRRNDIDLDTPEGREFALADNQTSQANMNFDFDVIESELEAETLEEWGMSFEQDVDYGALDDLDIGGALDDFQDGVMRAIQVEFNPEDYEEAYELISFWRERGYVGGIIMEFLKNEKSKI